MRSPVTKHTARVLVLGSSGCGKSSVCARLLGNEPTSAYWRTIEETSSFLLQQSGDEPPIHVRLTELGPTESCLYGLYSSMSDAVLVLIDNTNLESFHTAIQILEDVTNAKKPNQSDPNDGPAIILVITKCDVQPLILKEDELRKLYALASTSAKLNTGFAELKQVILHEVLPPQASVQCCLPKFQMRIHNIPYRRLFKREPRETINERERRKRLTQLYDMLHNVHSPDLCAQSSASLEMTRQQEERLARLSAPKHFPSYKQFWSMNGQMRATVTQESMLHPAKITRMRKFTHTCHIIEVPPIQKFDMLTSNSTLSKIVSLTACLKDKGKEKTKPDYTKM